MKKTINQIIKLINSPLSWRGVGGEAFLFSLLALSLTSCFSDDTTLGDRPLTEIIIDEESVKDVYNINKNETLVITPKYSQTNGQKDVKTT